MAVLSTTDYRSIMTDYAAAQNQLTGISDNYFNLIAAKLLQISRGYNVKNLTWDKK